MLFSWFTHLRSLLRRHTFREILPGHLHLTLLPPSYFFPSLTYFAPLLLLSNDITFELILLMFCFPSQNETHKEYRLLFILFVVPKNVLGTQQVLNKYMLNE